MTVTEVGVMVAKPGMKVLDASTPEGEMIRNIYTTILKAPGAPQMVYMGLEIENPSRLWGFFDWKTIEEHEEFAKSFGAEAVKDLPMIFSHGEFTKHVVLTPDPSVLWRSPITAVNLAFFPAYLSLSERTVILDKFQQILERSYDQTLSVEGFCTGWGVEQDFPMIGEDGQTGSVLMLFTGWTSIEASKNFQQTDVFRDFVGSVNTLGAIKFKSFHIGCKRLEI